jgi:hypothetical protein
MSITSDVTQIKDIDAFKAMVDKQIKQLGIDYDPKEEGSD